MRFTTLPALVLAAAATPALAQPASTVVAALQPERPATSAHRAVAGELGFAAPRTRAPAFLEADDIGPVVAPIAQDIERCYVGKLGRAGHLDLTLVIGHDGELITLRATAKGLSMEAARKVEACAGVSLAQLRFPARRNDTTAVVPYYFQRTQAPGAGPQPSCYSARGCAER